MRICSVDDLKPGYVLGKSIFISNYKLLLGAGYRLNEGIIDKLREKGFSHVYIMEEGTEEVIPEDVISDETRLEIREKFENKIQELNKTLEFKDMSYSMILESLEKGNLRNIGINFEMRTLIREIIDEMSETGVKYMNSLMTKSKDSYFFDHALNTAVLTILIGKKFQFSKQELVPLATGAFLHDIGKIVIDNLGNQGDGRKRDYYPEHPTFGYLLLRNDSGISPLILQTVNQHHERQDGKGFPSGLKGDNSPPVKTHESKKGMIFRFAEICSVADGYDRKLLTSKNGEKYTPLEVLKELVENTKTGYNITIVEALTEIVPIYPVGSFVRINSIIDPSLVGCYGVVAKVNEVDLSRPTIVITANKFRKKIKPIIIDTSKLGNIELKMLI